MDNGQFKKLCNGQDRPIKKIIQNRGQCAIPELKLYSRAFNFCSHSKSFTALGLTVDRLVRTWHFRALDYGMRANGHGQTVAAVVAVFVAADYVAAAVVVTDVGVGVVAAVVVSISAAAVLGRVRIRSGAGPAGVEADWPWIRSRAACLAAWPAEQV
eukprot:Colp12_sorted_trinity150504_noHs@17452